MLEAFDPDRLFEFIRLANDNDIHRFGFELTCSLDQERMDQIVARMKQKDEDDANSTIYEEFMAWQTIY